jgi:hypothetical protein
MTTMNRLRSRFNSLIENLVKADVTTIEIIEVPEA